MTETPTDTDAFAALAATAVRADIVAAHAAAWQAIAEPGTWWSGAQRVAIAGEARRARTCDLCARRKDALSPYAVEGEHAADGVLPASAVEAVHRIVTDPGRLKREWKDGLELTDAAYVELVGVTTAVVSVDALHRAVGVPIAELPAAQPGEPSRDEARPLGDMGAWVPVLDTKWRRPDGRRLFKGPMVPNVLRSLSIVPAEIDTLRTLTRAHYVPGLVVDAGANTGRAISRPQIELVAARVSTINECFY